MVLLQRWLLILFALVLGGGPLLAANPSREQRAYDAAILDFQREMWSRADTGFDQFLKKYRESTNAPMAVLLQAQAQIKQGKFSAAVGLLTDTNHLAGAQMAGLADQYARWTGEAQFMSGRFAEAAETFARAAKDFPQSPTALGMIVSAAAAREKLADWPKLDALLEEEDGIFQRAARTDPDNEQVAGGRLLLARSKTAQTNFPAALAVLNQLNPKTLTPDQEWNRSQLFYGIMLATGDLDATLVATTNLMTAAKKDPMRLANAAAAHALALEKKNLLTEAGVAWAENLKVAVPPENQRQAILKIVELSAAQNKFSDAAAALEIFLAQSPGSPATDLALLTAGEMHLKDFLLSGSTNAATNRLALAQAKFDQFLGVFTNSPLAGKAYLDRGWCRWLAGKFSESAPDFRGATQGTLSVPDLAVARFKLGDALFFQRDFTAARENYQLVLDSFSGDAEVMKSLGGRALYQILRASIELKDVTGVETALRGLLEKYPDGEVAAGGLLMAGEGFSDFNSPSAAREVLLKFAGQFPESPLKPAADFAVARTFEREQNWPEAIARHEDWLQNNPTNDLLPQVDYALSRVFFQAGDEASAFAGFTNFVAQFPTNELAPVAQWWLADHFFRAGNFIGAETNYDNVFQTPAWKNSPLIYPARLMAGRAAMGRQGFPDAKRYLHDLISDTNCPADLAVQARFAYGAVLMQMPPADTTNLLANYAAATNIFAQILAICPTNDAAMRAWGEVGDCDLQLGDYPSATNAYAQVFSTNSPADISMRSRAQVGLGIVLEKMAAQVSGVDQTNLLSQALDNYLAVFDGNNRRDEEKDSYWTKIAGLRAAPLVGLLNDIKVEINFYESLLTALPQLKDVVENKIAALTAEKN
jgi:TolA-binding protein